MKRKIVNAEKIAARLKAWQEMTPAQQLADLDFRLGKGVGAVKQRARIAAKEKK